MELRVAHATDRGRVRDQNEDAVLTDLPLIAVADGMGGHEGGEVASKLAVEVLARWKDRLADTRGIEASRVLRDALKEANRTVWERARTDRSVAGMGTTLTAGWIAGDVLAIAHVGDSRAYLLRGDKLEKLTEDQNLAQQWVRQGRLSQEEAATSPQRHIMLQAIGTEPSDPDVEIASVELKPGDRLLLATDGLYGMVIDNAKIREILTDNEDPAEACRLLVDEANAAGGQDNISVVIVDAGSAAGDAGPPLPVIVERPTSPTKRSVSGRRRIILAAAASVVVASILIVSASLGGPSYVLSSRHQHVVVLDGSVGRDGDGATGKVVRTYKEPLDRFSAPARRQLHIGIPVHSLAEADRVFANQPRLQGPTDTPTPAPSGPIGSVAPTDAITTTPPTAVAGAP